MESVLSDPAAPFWKHMVRATPIVDFPGDDDVRNVKHAT